MTPTPVPAISASLLPYKHYNPNSPGNVGLYLLGMVYTTNGELPVANRTIVVHVSYVYGGITYNDTISLGPTDSTGFVTSCGTHTYPAAVQLTIGFDAVSNAPGPDSQPQSDIQVHNQGYSDRPDFCP